MAKFRPPGVRSALRLLWQATAALAAAPRNMNATWSAQKEAPDVPGLLRCLNHERNLGINVPLDTPTLSQGSNQTKREARIATRWAELMTVAAAHEMNGTPRRRKPRPARPGPEGFLLSDQRGNLQTVPYYPKKRQDRDQQRWEKHN
jgi:hypothetical protein